MQVYTLKANVQVLLFEDGNEFEDSNDIQLLI